MSRSAKRPSCVFFSVLALLGASEGIAVAAGDDLAFFEAKIRPVLVERCQKCHSSQVPKPKGGLRVDSRSALRGGIIGTGDCAWKLGRQPALPGNHCCRRNRAHAPQREVDCRRKSPISAAGSLSAHPIRGKCRRRVQLCALQLQPRIATIGGRSSRSSDLQFQTRHGAAPAGPGIQSMLSFWTSLRKKVSQPLRRPIARP